MPVSAGVLAAQRRYMQQQQLRAQMAQQSRGGQGRGGRGVQVGAVGQGRAVKQQQRAQQAEQKAVQADNNARWEQAKANMHANAKPQEADGIKGLLGSIIESPVGQVLTAPFKPLAYIQRGAIAGLQEVREHVPAPFLAGSGLAAPLLLMDRNTAKEDPRSWWDKTTDENYGFGQTARQVDTGHEGLDEWANRGVGLWGDIALDPTTYASGGLDKIPGATGRAALAKEAIEKELSKEVVEAAGKKGARGVRKLGDEAAIEALALPKPGIRLGGQNGIRLAGTGKLDFALNKTLAGVRRPFTNTWVGKAARMAGASRNPATREAIESLLGIKGSKGYEAVQAAIFPAVQEVAKGESNILGAEFANMVEDIGKLSKGKGNEAITHAIEAGDLTHKAAAMSDEFYGELLQAQRKAGASVGEMANEELAGYVPKILNDQGREAFKHATSKVGGAASLLTPEASQFSRVIVPGEKYIIKGKVYKPVTASIKEGNEWAVKNLGYKIYEDDPGKLAAHALRQAQDTVGKAVPLNELAKAGIHQQVFSTIDPRVTKIAKKASAAASKKAGPGLAEELRPLLMSLADAEQVGARTGAAATEATDALKQFDTMFGSEAAGAIPPSVPGAAPMGAVPDNPLVQDAFQQAAGAPPALDQHLGSLQAPQAAEGAVGGATPNLSEQAAPALEQIAGARQNLTHYQWATQMSDIAGQAGTGATKEALEAQIAKLPPPAQKLMRQTLAADRSPQAMDRFLGDIAKGKLNQEIVRKANKGFELLETDRLIGRDVIINSEMKRVMDDSRLAMERFNKTFAAESHLFGRVVSEMTQFFRAWALATPGQHVRNGTAATIMNMSEGVTPSEMLDAFKIVKAFRVNPRGDWVQISKLEPHLQELAEPVMKAVYASGAGGMYDLSRIARQAAGSRGEHGLLAKAWFLSYDNPITRASQNFGERWVESPMRAALALHVLGSEGSGSWTEALTRIKRIHFDYSEMNELDRAVHGLIPFWTFMSRNLPLQLQQQWTSPRVYVQYEKVMGALNADPEGNQLMPPWLQRMGGTFINGGGSPIALAPDVGASQVQNYLGQIADPKQLLQNFNPAAKSAIEILTNHDVFYDEEYKDNDYQKVGLEMYPFLPFLAAIGKVRMTPEGPVVERKWQQVVRDNIPLVGTTNRLGSTTSDREGKGWSSAASFIGIPLRTVDQAKERKSRQFEARDAAKQKQSYRNAMAKFH